VFADFHHLRYAKRVAIGVMYRPPWCKINSFEHLEAILEALSMSGKQTFILGDLNCNILKTGHEQIRLTQVLSNYGYQQCVTQPTRITEDTRACLDLVLTNKPELVTFIASMPCAISDHNLVICNLVLPQNKRAAEVITYRSYRNFSEQDSF